MDNEEKKQEAPEEEEVKEQPQAEEEKEEELSGKEKRKLGKQLKELENKLKKAEKEQEKATQALLDANDKYLRMLAEFDNYKKRTAKEGEAKYANAYCDAVEALLPVFDNIERAVLYSESGNFADGMKAIVGQISTAMEKLGIETFGDVGEAFDPMLHNAVMHVEDENLGENVITEVFQKGYKKGDRIIRHAMVKVAN